LVFKVIVIQYLIYDNMNDKSEVRVLSPKREMVKNGFEEEDDWGENLKYDDDE